jgi:hypothetical protein
MGTEQFCLRWNDFHSNITAAFSEIRDEDDFFDVTLVSSVPVVPVPGTGTGTVFIYISRHHVFVATLRHIQIIKRQRHLVIKTM